MLAVVIITILFVFTVFFLAVLFAFVDVAIFSAVTGILVTIIPGFLDYSEQALENFSQETCTELVKRIPDPFGGMSSLTEKLAEKTLSSTLGTLKAKIPISWFDVGTEIRNQDLEKRKQDFRVAFRDRTQVIGIDLKEFEAGSDYQIQAEGPVIIYHSGRNALDLSGSVKIQSEAGILICGEHGLKVNEKLPPQLKAPFVVSSSIEPITHYVSLAEGNSLIEFNEKKKEFIEKAREIIEETRQKGKTHD